ncbi:DUF6383 domain-containing protein [Parabacteroides sp.]
MNKRFSTLLAAVLVAGGLSAVNASPADLSAKKYYHLKEATSNKYVGLSDETLKADSLCLYDPATLTVKQVDQLLWSVSEKRVATANGGVVYQYEFTNKYTGEKLSMDPSRANHNLDATAAMGVRPGSVKVWSQSTQITQTETSFNLTYTVKADKAAKDSVLWLATGANTIKLMSVVGAGATATSPANFQLVSPAPVVLDATALAAVMSSEGFKLNFKTNATSDAYENPFTKYTLKAVAATEINGTHPIHALLDPDPSFSAARDAALEKMNTAKTTVEAAILLLDQRLKSFINGAPYNTGGGAEVTFGTANTDNGYTTENATADKKALDALKASGSAYALLGSGDQTKIDAVTDLAAAVKTQADGTVSETELDAYTAAAAKIAIITADAATLTTTADCLSLGALFAAPEVETSFDAFNNAIWAWNPTSTTDNLTTANPANFVGSTQYSAAASALNALFDAALATADATIAKAYTTAAGKTTCARGATTSTISNAVYLEAVGQKSSDADAVRPQMYVVADTVRLTPTQDYVRFSVDTLAYASYGTTNTGNAAAKGRNSLLPYAFKFTKYVDNVNGDSLAIETWAPKAPYNDQLWREVYFNDFAIIDQAAVVGYRKSQNQIQITPILKNSSDYYPDNVADFTTVISFNMGDAKTDLDTKAYYFIISKNNADKADASKLNANRDKAFYTTTAFGDSSVLVSRSQWTVEQEVAGTNNYVFMNRETGVTLGGKLFTVDADNNIYAMGSDTIQLAVVALPEGEAGKYVGYKHITDFNQVNTKYALQVKSFLSGDAAGYMVMKKDSSLAFVKGEIGDAQMVKMTQESIEAMADDSSHIASYSLMADEKYYLVKNTSNQLVFTTVKPTAATVFALRATKNEGQYEVLVGAVAAKKFTPANQLTVDQNGNVSLVATTATNAYVFDMVEEPSPASLITLPKHVTIKTSTGDNFAMDAKNNGVAVREGDLKAAYAESDFVFWLDTAKYEDQAVPSYYLTKGVAATEGVEASRLFMYNAKDSAAVTALKDKYTAYSATRFVFREAKTYGADSLIVMNYDSKLKEMAPDTVTIDSKAGAGKGANKTTLLKGINNFRFEFVQAKDEAEGVYNVKNVASSDYVRNLNGVLVVSSAAEGVKVTVENASAPTSNEAINASEVAVITQKGAVRIANAEGKKVVITNILGQEVANTVITSSDATIAAPAGVVVVAVEGEAAVKAIVK